MPQTWEGHTSTSALDVFFLRPPMQLLSGVDTAQRESITAKSKGPSSGQGGVFAWISRCGRHGIGLNR